MVKNYQHSIAYLTKKKNFFDSLPENELLVQKYQWGTLTNRLDELNWFLDNKKH